MRICRVATVPFFFNHHLGVQLRDIRMAGHELHIACSSGQGYEKLAAIVGEGRVHRVEIPRRVSPVGDLLALGKLISLFRRQRFDIVHSTTPKAGLLSAIAAKVAGIPVRMHTFTGQQWMELSGLLRSVSVASDRLVARLNTQCYADSQSQRTFLIEKGIAAAERLLVLANGSLSGVDVNHLADVRESVDRGALRKDLAIPDGSFVVTFVGRVTRDKGILELLSAFERVSREAAESFLIIVGPVEGQKDAALRAALSGASGHPRIRMTGYDPAAGKYFCITDVLCLPSYREGFGNVVLEAAVMGVPTVGTRIVGLVDAIEDGKTGILVPAKNPAALAAALECLRCNPRLRSKLGEEAKMRAITQFSAERISRAVLAEYERLLTLSAGKCA
jgi:glycosyltransferase involved in cell wall biosynthesis